jgi:hypothetical protein
MGEAFLVERFDDDFERLFVALARLLDRYAGLDWDPGMTAAEADS